MHHSPALRFPNPPQPTRALPRCRSVSRLPPRPSEDHGPTRPRALPYASRASGSGPFLPPLGRGHSGEPVFALCSQRDLIRIAHQPSAGAAYPRYLATTACDEPVLAGSLRLCRTFSNVPELPGDATLAAESQARLLRRRSDNCLCAPGRSLGVAVGLSWRLRRSSPSLGNGGTGL